MYYENERLKDGRGQTENLLPNYGACYLSAV